MKKSSLAPYIIFTLFVAMFVGFNVFAYKSINSLGMFISEYGLLVIITTFFVIVDIYMIFYLLVTEYFPQKLDTMCLFSIDSGDGIFVDKKGKKYIYSPKSKYLISDNVGKYFEVRKNVCTITSIENISSNYFEITKVKDKFWLNFYSVVGNFEEIFLLPIVYVILIPFILAIFLSGFPYNLVMFIFIIPVLFVALYDIFFKLKRRVMIKKILEETNPLERARRYNSINDSEEFKEMFLISNISMEIFKNAISLIVSLGITGFMIFVLINVEGIFSILLIPFTIAVGTTFVVSLINFILGLPTKKSEEENKLRIAKAEKLKYLIGKVYMYAFLAYWFGILIIGSKVAIENGETTVLFATIPFWITGIAVLINTIRS